MIDQIFFILTILQFIFNNGLAASGLIWDKKQQNFVELYSIPKYAALHAETRAKNRQAELYRFNRKPVRVSYFEIIDMIIFYENDTKITGITGDLWTDLSNYLNFTLIPIKDKTSVFNKLLPNGSYDGILTMFKQNKTDVILRIAYYGTYSNDIAYTIPIYRTGYSLLIRPKWQYDNMWLISMFSSNIWYFIISLFVILSIFGFVAQKIPTINSKEFVNFNLSDHIFHTFAIMCAQGYLPKDYFDKFKILSSSKSIFSWLIFLTFSSNLIYRMSNKKELPLFYNITDLLTKTDYTIISYNGSWAHDLFTKRINRFNRKNNYKFTNRVIYTEEYLTLYRTICHNSDKYTVLEMEDLFKSLRKYFCTLIPIGNHYFNTWITFGIQKYLPYKRTLDVAIIKMHEVGLIQRLKNYWWFKNYENKNNDKFQQIDLNQIYVILCILSIGFVASFFVLAIEHLVFYYESRKKREKKC